MLALLGFSAGSAAASEMLGAGSAPLGARELSFVAGTGPPVASNLAAAMPNSGSELLKGADDDTATEVAVKIGDNEVAISKDELGELLATKKDTYKEALTAGFTTAEEGTAAQIKTIAAASSGSL